MFANRFTAFVDACVLASALKRNLLLTLAEAEFFRVRWSSLFLDETQAAITEILSKRGVQDYEERARRARASLEVAFADALVTNFDSFLRVDAGMPDDKDIHVLAAALKTRADVIVTDNLKDFPPHILHPLSLDARSADAFLADTIALDVGRAVSAIRVMRERLNNPSILADSLLIKIEAAGLMETADILRPHVGSL